MLHLNGLRCNNAAAPSSPPRSPPTPSVTTSSVLVSLLFMESSSSSTPIVKLPNIAHQSSGQFSGEAAQIQTPGAPNHPVNGQQLRHENSPVGSHGLFDQVHPGHDVHATPTRYASHPPVANERSCPPLNSPPPVVRTGAQRFDLTGGTTGCDGSSAGQAAEVENARDDSSSAAIPWTR